MLSLLTFATLYLSVSFVLLIGTRSSNSDVSFTIITNFNIEAKPFVADKKYEKYGRSSTITIKLCVRTKS